VKHIIVARERKEHYHQAYLLFFIPHPLRSHILDDDDGVPLPSPLFHSLLHVIAKVIDGGEPTTPQSNTPHTDPLIF
jgi:hypothetical protein